MEPRRDTVGPASLGTRWRVWQPHINGTNADLRRPGAGGDPGASQGDAPEEGPRRVPSGARH